MLPSLDDGLYWDTSAILDSGILSVANMLPGDFDLDGNVDGADFLAWQRVDGTAAGLAIYKITTVRRHSPLLHQQRYQSQLR